MNTDYISNRIKNLAESATLKMTQKSRELKAQGNDVIALSIGEPDFDTPSNVKEAAKKAIDENYTHYTPVAGYPELRKAVVQKLKRDNDLNYTPEQVVVSNGAKQSIANVMYAILNPGDEVIIPSPYWVSYPAMVTLAGGNIVEVQTGIETDFKFTAEQFEAAITGKTKAIIFSSPCNPTGSIYTYDELEAIAKVLEKNPQIFVISDEIYELINFKGKHESMAQFDAIKDQVITINGVSKGFAMTGWRIGYIAAPLAVAKACDKLQGQYTSGASSIAQMATIEALLTSPSKSEELKNMIKTFNERRDLVVGLLKAIPGIKTNTPDGAFYVFPKVNSYFGKKFENYTINNATDLCMYILETEYVGLVPGDAFGSDECIRISYATSNEILKEAIVRVERALSKLQ